LAGTFIKNKKLKTKTGQVTLEISLVFMAVVFFLLGILRIWLWSNYNIVESQHKFNQTRVEAGSPSTPGELPTDLNKLLTEDWLFKGQWE